MVKNGHNSVLHISASAQEDSCPNRYEAQSRPYVMKTNKNRFRPISEQACALQVWARRDLTRLKTRKTDRVFPNTPDRSLNRQVLAMSWCPHVNRSLWRLNTVRLLAEISPFPCLSFNSFLAGLIRIDIALFRYFSAKLSCGHDFVLFDCFDKRRIFAIKCLPRKIDFEYWLYLQCLISMKSLYNIRLNRLKRDYVPRTRKFGGKRKQIYGIIKK